MNKILRIMGKNGRITIPYNLRFNTGIGYGSLLTFEQKDDRTVVITRETLCTDCSEPPTKDNDGTITLIDFLDCLTEEQKKAVLVHLSTEWAMKQGGQISE